MESHHLLEGAAHLGDGPAPTRADLKVELERDSETVTLSRPQNGLTATLSRTAKPKALVPLPRRETRECLAEDLRRLDADAIYFSALEGIDRVEYV
jgi:glucose-6-phosphate dehydrogenase assembly protein OpcA